VTERQLSSRLITGRDLSMGPDLRFSIAMIVLGTVPVALTVVVALMK
jgi:hypothetical protein